jgi:hypothetical protein
MTCTLHGERLRHEWIIRRNSIGQLVATHAGCGRRVRLRRKSILVARMAGDGRL